MIESLLKQMAATRADCHAKRTSLYLLLKRKLGNHVMTEEDIVYPLLHEEVMERDRSQILYEEHADMKALLHELEECLTFRSEWHEPLDRLSSLIHEHIKEEEQVVFPRVRDLGSEKLPDLSGQIRRDEAVVL